MPARARPGFIRTAPNPRTLSRRISQTRIVLRWTNTLAPTTRIETDNLIETDAATDASAGAISLIEETSTEFLGQWNRLVSTTNWEKGRIICQWRDKLIEAGAAPSSSTDEAWSRWVGNVSRQHAGRLRRVYQRFGSVYRDYAGLYWSHFQAALDWDDAEMWLEGAVGNAWSIAQMRYQRWETMGAPADKKPRDEDVFSGELDDDAGPAGQSPTPPPISESFGTVQDAEPAPWDETSADAYDATGTIPADDAGSDVDEPSPRPVRPFENLAALPPDLQDAFEAFKLAVLHHRLSGWQEVACDDVLAALDALKQLAAAPPSR